MYTITSNIVIMDYSENYIPVLIFLFGGNWDVTSLPYVWLL